MKKIHLSLLFSLALLTASSQKVYFVYIQTESEQPFFVKMNDKIQSSTAAGYIIMSKLVDSTYSFSIGFPQNKWPEQNFSVVVGKKDHGYLLKNFNEKGWGLFDLQTLSVQMAITGKANIEQKPVIENKDVSVFTTILAKAADDPTLKEKPVQPKVEEKKIEVAVVDVKKNEESTKETKETKEPVSTTPAKTVDVVVVKKEEPKPEIKEAILVKQIEMTEQPVVKKENTISEANESMAVTQEKQEDAKSEVSGSQKPEVIKEEITDTYKASQVKRWSESSTTEGFGLVFIDNYENGAKDTIRLIIPNPKPAVGLINEEPKEEKKFLDITAIPSQTEEKVVEKAALKSNCNEIATETDFFELRKRMAAAEGDVNMIAEAQKYFKIKCFTTAQLRNIASLFLTDEGKYKFFDAAYKYTSDTEAFNLLQDELKDEYYTSRFKAILRN